MVDGTLKSIELTSCPVGSSHNHQRDYSDTFMRCLGLCVALSLVMCCVVSGYVLRCLGLCVALSRFALSRVMCCVVPGYVLRCPGLCVALSRVMCCVVPGYVLRSLGLCCKCHRPLCYAFLLKPWGMEL